MSAAWDRLRAVVDRLPRSWAAGLGVILDALQRGEHLTDLQRDALRAVVGSDLHESLPAVWETAWTLNALDRFGAEAFDWMSVDDAISRAEAGR